MKENNILKILSRISKNIFSPSGTSFKQIIDSNTESADLSLDIRQREKAIYGEDNIKQQKLYEKWTVKTSWHLKDEAIPLLLSIDPEIYANSSVDETIKQKYQGLWEHAQHCVEQGLLSVTKKEGRSEEWEATPIDVYQWAAVSRVELPAQLIALMEFVMMTLLPTSASNSSSGDKIDKELILGSALAVLVAYPKLCLNKEDRVKATTIVALINDNKDKLFAGKTPELSSTASINLIEKWINVKFS